MYDDIINKPSNDWDLYYWMTGASAIPVEFDNEVMDLMVEHAKNTRMEVRLSQPPLVSKAIFWKVRAIFEIYVNSLFFINRKLMSVLRRN